MAKKGSKKKASPGGPSVAMLREPENEEVDTYIFCRHRMNRYIEASTSWKQFRGGTNAQFRFHRLNLPEHALKAEIELFAARLDKYLLGLGYAGREGARYEIRSAVTPVTEKTQGLLDKVAENYLES